MAVTIGVLNLSTIPGDVTALQIGRCPEHGYNVKECTGAQWIMHNVKARTGPKHNIIAVDAGRHV